MDVCVTKDQEVDSFFNQYVYVNSLKLDYCSP